MVTINRIYTRTGDKGTTALVTGERRLKSDLRIEAYGTVDEVNAILGLTRLHSSSFSKLDQELERIQNDLFDLGADLATPEKTLKKKSKESRGALRITAKQVKRLEQEIDSWNALLEPLRSFILPGGTALAANLHHARTVTRRTERLVVTLLQREEDISPVCLEYLNRLSDYFFVTARVANDNGKQDILWRPGENT